MCLQTILGYGIYMWLGLSKEVEFQVKDSQRVQDGTQDQPIIDSHGFDFDDDDPQEEQETSIAASR
jgi:hypothetical protein